MYAAMIHYCERKLLSRIFWTCKPKEHQQRGNSHNLQASRMLHDHSKERVMLEVLIYIQSIVHLKFIPGGRIVNKYIYVDNLVVCMSPNLKEKTKILRCAVMWELYDQAPAHRSLLATDFLAKTKTIVLSHPPYSPDFTP
ncbi:hypothetical protein TNCV_1993611 [Trichonephila clavipes]|nr:hypothetical protein TNCV_1993611 [Trichonephila clavipes]